MFIYNKYSGCIECPVLVSAVPLVRTATASLQLLFDHTFRHTVVSSHIRRDPKHINAFLSSDMWAGLFISTPYSFLTSLRKSVSRSATYTDVSGEGEHAPPPLGACSPL